MKRDKEGERVMEKDRGRQKEGGGGGRRSTLIIYLQSRMI